jgi:hypothetical protein
MFLKQIYLIPYYFTGLFSSNHSTIEFIAHTAPDDKIPSKNQLIHNGVPNKVKVGENITNDKKNPPHVEKHIGQDNIPDMNFANELNGK